ncbi:class I SAM-dependent methyltransferase [Larkinella sp. VNQ87]|uniref:class I SAM-dependent methyltransferase n=1 Tax=Larkinella sp. VNQ87 TaxID=3400921 RepID=UPI003C017120
MTQLRATDSGFDGIASFYDFLSRLVFGNALLKAQSRWLDLLPARSTILIFGGGTGWLLARLLATCDPRKIIYLDASPKMISMSRKRVKDDPRVDFRIGTETSVRSNDRVDVVITPFILDLFSENRLKNRILPPLLTALRPNGWWLCSDFLPPRRGWQRLLLWSQYRFFRTVSRIEARNLPNWVGMLNDSLTPGDIQPFFGGMIGSGYWQKIG